MGEKRYQATLVRGETYTLGRVVFRRGEPRPVDQETRDHLDEHAVDVLTVGSGPERANEQRSKFHFEELDAEGRVVPPPARAGAGRVRVRRPALPE